MAHQLLDEEAARAALRDARRIAVLGIKPEDRAGQHAYDIPKMLVDAGYDVVPVPVRYPEVTEILSRPVVRELRDLPPGIDILNLFRRPEDVPAHLEDMLAVRPGLVWFQPGCLHQETAEALMDAGIPVVHTCIKIALQNL